MDIFIMGKAGSGKDTVAALFKRKLGINCNTYALATPIREEHKRFYPKGDPRKDREALQRIGQGYKQIYGQDVWVKMTDKQIWKDKILPSQFEIDAHAVISDGRHQIEYDFFVGQKGFLPVWVDCPDEIRLARLLKRDGTLQEKALENEVQDLWNSTAFILDNSGTLEELQERVDSIFTEGGM